MTSRMPSSVSRTSVPPKKVVAVISSRKEFSGSASRPRAFGWSPQS